VRQGWKPSWLTFLFLGGERQEEEGRQFWEWRESVRGRVVGWMVMRIRTLGELVRAVFMTAHSSVEPSHKIT
jgi:hypothetical protein